MEKGIKKAEKKQWFNFFRRRKGKLERGDGWIGGVCEGMGNHFNVDPNLFRLLLLVTSIAYGFGILPYIILWIIIPEE